MQRGRGKTTTTPNFGSALRWARHVCGMPQEQFDQVSSRTYVSALERGLKDPTLGKIDSLAGVLGMHPVSLVTMSYVSRPGIADVDALLDLVREELQRALDAGVIAAP